MHIAFNGHFIETGVIFFMEMTRKYKFNIFNTKIIANSKLLQYFAE